MRPTPGYPAARDFLAPEFSVTHFPSSSIQAIRRAGRAARRAMASARRIRGRSAGRGGAALFALAALLAAPASAYEPPEGCEPLVTLRDAACEVRHVMHCPQLAENDSDKFVATTRDGNLVRTTLQRWGYHVAFVLFADGRRDEYVTMDPDFLASVSPPRPGLEYSERVAITRRSLNGVRRETMTEDVLSTRPGALRIDRDQHPVVILDWRHRVPGVSGTSGGTTHYSPSLGVELGGARWARDESGALIGESDDRVVEMSAPGERGFLSDAPAAFCDAMS